MTDVLPEILLVEDNPADVELTLHAFRESRLANQMRVVRDGAEALDQLHGSGAATLPAVILLDLKLPKVDGLEVLRRIRGDERTALLPVVILTSSREERDLVSGYSLGANSYVRKPVDFSRFVEQVQRLQVYWLLVHEPLDRRSGPAPLR